MGCTSSRQGKNREELAIRKQEICLGFHKLASPLVDRYFHKYSTNNSINLNQWRDIVFYLRLTTVNSPDSPNIQEFYNKFKVDGCVRSKLLHLLGVMLSKDSKRNKATLIFQIYDEHNISVLTTDTLKEMINDMADLSLSQVPALALTSDTQRKPELTSYINLLQIVSSELRAWILQRCMQETHFEELPKTITLERFISSMTSEHTWSVLEPRGIRKLGLELYRGYEAAELFTSENDQIY